MTARTTTSDERLLIVGAPALPADAARALPPLVHAADLLNAIGLIRG